MRALGCSINHRKGIFFKKVPQPDNPPEEHKPIRVTHGNPAGPDTAPTEDPICWVGGWGWREEPAPQERKPPPACRSCAQPVVSAAALLRALSLSPSHTHAHSLLPHQPCSSQSGPARSRPAHDLGPALPRTVLERQVFGGTPPHAAISMDV